MPPLKPSYQQFGRGRRGGVGAGGGGGGGGALRASLLMGVIVIMSFLKSVTVQTPEKTTPQDKIGA